MNDLQMTRWKHFHMNLNRLLKGQPQGPLRDAQGPPEELLGRAGAPLAPQTCRGPRRIPFDPLRPPQAPFGGVKYDQFDMGKHIWLGNRKYEQLLKQSAVASLCRDPLDKSPLK